MIRRLGLIGMTMGILFAGGTMAASAQTAAPQASQFARQSAPAEETQQRKRPANQKPSAGAAWNLHHRAATDSRTRFSTAPKHFLLDQKAMWTSPLHMSVPEATWLVPVAGFTAGLFATDSDFMRQLSHNPSTLTRYDHISNYGLGAMGGVAGGAYVLGLITHNEHERETGFLSGEAAVDSLVATEAIAYMTRPRAAARGQRQRAILARWQTLFHPTTRPQHGPSQELWRMSIQAHWSNCFLTAPLPR